MASDLVERFLNTEGWKWETITVVEWRDPIDEGKLAKSIIGAIISLIAMGWYGLLDGVVAIVVEPLTATASWFVDVITSLTDELTTILWTAATSTSGDLGGLPGIVSWPLGVAIVLSSLVIATWGIQRLRGGV